MSMEYDIGSLGMGEQIELDGGVGLGLYHYHDNVPSTDGMGLAQAPAPPQAPAPAPVQVQVQQPQGGLALNPPTASALGANLMKSVLIGAVVGGVTYGVGRWRKDDDAAMNGFTAGAITTSVAALVGLWSALKPTTHA